MCRHMPASSPSRLMAPCRNGWQRAFEPRFKSRNCIRGNAGRSVQGVGGNWNLPATTPSTEMSSSRDSQRSAVPPTSSRTSANSTSLASLSRRERFAGKPMIRWSSTLRRPSGPQSTLSLPRLRFPRGGAHRISPARGPLGALVRLKVKTIPTDSGHRGHRFKVLPARYASKLDARGRDR